MSLPELSSMEQRVLGALLEKEITVPAGYPLSLNSLRLACNQSSSRDPVMELDERSVETAARQLRELGLANVGWSDSGRRTRKYAQSATQALHLDEQERALLTVLLLRGAQTVGELNARSERLFTFADKAAVQTCLDRLAARDLPLVRLLPRRPGQHDPRWVHLLGPIEAAAAPPAAAGAAAGRPPGQDGEAPLAHGASARDASVRAAYAAVAGEYADEQRNMLAQLPFERWLLELVSTAVRQAGSRPVVDVGCGPGVVTAFLADTGLEMTGIDLTPEMIEQARALHPELTFQTGDLNSLMRPSSADGWGAVVAWYSLIHLADSELPGAIAALTRPLAPGGVLSLAMHAGTHVRTLTEWFDQSVDLTFLEREPAAVVAAVEAAGLVDVQWFRRGPRATLGENSERLYLIASRPA